MGTCNLWLAGLWARASALTTKPPTRQLSSSLGTNPSNQLGLLTGELRTQSTDVQEMIVYVRHLRVDGGSDDVYMWEGVGQSL